MPFDRVLVENLCFSSNPVARQRRELTSVVPFNTLEFLLLTRYEACPHQPKKALPL